VSDTETLGPTSDGTAEHSDVDLVEKDGDEVEPDPPVPEHLGNDLAPELREKLHTLLLHGWLQLSDVYRAMVSLPGAGPTELLPLTACANSGVVGNRRVVVFAIMNGIEPTSASVARQAASTVRSMYKASKDEAVVTHLAHVLAALEATSTSTQAVELETEQLESNSAELADALKQAEGVYVYTYPHYWRHPYVPDSERRLLKVGRTTQKAWNRVVNQARQTGMPEDPLLLRVYKTDDPTAAEKDFHMLLDAAEHQRSVGTAVGKEWFVTTVEYCDAVATALKLTVLKGRTTRYRGETSRGDLATQRSRVEINPTRYCLQDGRFTRDQASSCNFSHAAGHLERIQSLRNPLVSWHISWDSTATGHGHRTYMLSPASEQLGSLRSSGGAARQVRRAVSLWAPP
jgi:hypothetical protein